jgi:ankyrin repeat protein
MACHNRSSAANFERCVEIYAHTILVLQDLVHARGRTDDDTPLHLAASEVSLVVYPCCHWRLKLIMLVHESSDCPQGHADLASVLISAGANVKAVDSTLYTPLHWAAGKGHLDVVKVRVRC